MRPKFSKLALFMLLSGLCAFGQTTSTITGTIRDLTQALVTSGKVTFTLAPSRDTTISGYARFSPQTVTCGINGSGQVLNQALSGACIITMNTALMPTGTYYRVDIYPFNVKTSSFTFYAVLSSYDWSTVVPTPTTSPAQNYVDIFSNQTIAGNKSFSGSTTFSGNSTFSGTSTFSGPATFSGLTFSGSATGNLPLANAGVFSNTQQNNYLTSALGGINPLTWYAGGVAGGPYSTDAIAGGAAVPNGANVHQIDGIAGFVNSLCDSRVGGNLGNICNAVGGYFVAWDKASNAAVWGINPIVQDAVGTSNTWMIGEELDINVLGSPAYMTAFQGNGTGTGTMPSAVTPGQISTLGAAFMDIASPYVAVGGSSWRWPLGINFRRGSLNGTALQVDAACNFTVVSCASNPITFTGYDGANVAHTASVAVDQFGSFVLTAPSGAGVRQPARAFSTYPACAAGTEGTQASITDSTTITWGATVTGGGANHVLGYCDGTNWTVAGK